MPSQTQIPSFYSRFHPYQKYFAGITLFLSALLVSGVSIPIPYAGLVLLILAIVAYAPANVFLAAVFWIIVFAELVPMLCTGSVAASGLSCSLPGLEFFGQISFVYGIFGAIIGSPVVLGVILASIEWLVRCAIRIRKEARGGFVETRFWRSIFISLVLGFFVYIIPYVFAFVADGLGF